MPFDPNGSSQTAALQNDCGVTGFGLKARRSVSLASGTEDIKKYDLMKQCNAKRLK